MRAAFARLCGTLEEVTSREQTDRKGDSRTLVDIELLRENADDWTRGLKIFALSRYAGG